MKSSGIGGQAVLEGVMMKNKNCYAVAVRKPNNEIEVKKEEFGAGERRALFKMPIFRGMATFVESLVLGMHALTYSSSFYEEEEGQKEVSKTKETLVDVGVVVLSVLMAIVVFILFPLFISSMLGRFIKSETLQLVLEGFLRLFMFIAYIALISRLNDIKRVFMYHGAEHKCINCVEQGYELTIANVKKQSKCHKRCGTSFMLVVMLVSFVLFMFIRVEEAWLRYVLRIVLIPVVAGISYEFIRLAGNTENKLVNFLSRPGLWMQGLTTREPDDSMIEVAIASVEAVFDWRGYQEKEGIAKYRKDSFGRVDKKERQSNDSDIKGSNSGKSPAAPGAASGSAGRPSAAPKERRVEKTSLGSRPEAKPAAVNRKKENIPAAGVRKEEKPVAKTIRKEDRPVGKSGVKTEAPIARAGIKEDKTAVRIGGAEKALPKSGVKTIKPLGKAETKPEKPAVRGGNQGEKPVAKAVVKGIKATGKENLGILSGTGKEEKTMPKGVKKDRKPVGDEKGITAKEKKDNIGNTEMPVNEEVAAVEIRGIEVNEDTAGKIPETAVDVLVEGAQKAAENAEVAVSKEVAEEVRETAVNEEETKEVLEIATSEETAREEPEITVSAETAGEEPEIAVSEETAGEASKIAVSKETAEEAPEIAVSEETAEETPEAAGNEEVAGEAPEVVVNEETAEETPEAVVNEEIAGEAPEIPVREAVMEKPQEMPVNTADGKIVGETVVKAATEETPTVPNGNTILDTAKETRNVPKNREQDRRRNNLISFMSMPDDEEDDEILRALDRYFVYEEEDSEENR